MFEIKGTYSTAKIFTEIIEDSAKEQIQTLCDQAFCQNAKVRIMPDVHTGAGCVIGFTADLGTMVIPNIVGVDIGCGMLTVALEDLEIDFQALDDIIRAYVPHGKNVHPGRMVRYPELMTMHCYRDLKNSKRLERSIGTLGGGNHFIEVDVDDQGKKYLVIHTGSRNLGKQVAEYYQQLAIDILSGRDKLFEQQDKLILQYKAEGRKNELQEAIKALRKEFQGKSPDIPQALCYLTGDRREQYLHDMQLCQSYATLNRQTIANIILGKLTGNTLADYAHFETIHNYIDPESNIVRKGAVSAKEGELILIPINMRDGSLICRGKGNEDWNNSAPHGAGRILSRTAAKETFTMEAFQASMAGIFTTSVSPETLDECPMTYKDAKDIIDNIDPTAEILKVIRPLYNFKSSN